jgi:hypothetical protein
MEARTVCNTARQIANYTLFYDRGRKIGNMYGTIRKLPKIYEYPKYRSQQLCPLFAIYNNITVKKKLFFEFLIQMYMDILLHLKEG